jgi:hypothetical protein
MKPVTALLAAALFAMPAHVAHADPKLTPSAPLKAYKGPEGELVVMVEITNSTEMLVYFKNTGGALEGKTLRETLEDLGNGRKNVFVTKKRGSKTYRDVLAAARDNAWEAYLPYTPQKTLELAYSEDATAKIKLDEVLNAYKP